MRLYFYALFFFAGLFSVFIVLSLVFGIIFFPEMGWERGFPRLVLLSTVSGVVGMTAGILFWKRFLLR